MKKIFLILIITLATYAQEVYATFNVVAYKSANLAFNISGIVKDINADIGSKVKKGDLLATLKSDDAKANVDLAKVTLKFAKKDLQRAKKAGSALDRAKYDAFLYKYEVALAKLNYLKAIYKKSFLRAPFDGVITAKLIEVGDGISAMPPKVAFKIESLNRRKLILEFDQKYYSKVKKGDKFIYSFDGEDKTYEGTISKIYPSIDKKSAKARAEVETLNIPSGLFGTGTIKVGN